MKKKYSRYQKIENKVVTRFNNLINDDEEASNLYEDFNRANNSYLRAHRVESSTFDTKWINVISDAIRDIDDIIRDPRKVTKTVTSIVPTELAKKTNGESVRHLASHTQYVKSIDEFGNVTPSKILNIETEDEYLTYENKFVATVIKRLYLFVEKRYSFVKQFLPLKTYEVMNYKSKTIIDGSEVEIETKIKVAKETENPDHVKYEKVIQQIEEVRRYVRYFYMSDFMKMFKNESEVRAPILQTNIIRKNPKYRHCYELYKFIESYRDLGVNYVVDEKVDELNKEEISEINYALLHEFLVLRASEPSKNGYRKRKTSKPKIKTSIDDEIFSFSPIVTKELDFVRVDDEYINYQEAEVKHLDPHPKKEEKEFNKELYEKKEELKRQRRREKELLKRKEKEEKEFLLKQEKLKKEKERLEAKKAAELKRIEEKRKLELLKLARAELKSEAANDKKIEEE